MVRAPGCTGSPAAVTTVDAVTGPGQQRPDNPVAAFASVLGGDTPADPGPWCSFREVRWSYRQPISYDVVDCAGRLVATLRPTDRSTRTSTVVRVGESPYLLLEHDQRGNTVVRTAAGSEIGGFFRLWAVRYYRLRVRHLGRELGLVEQHWRNAGLACVVAGGTPAAWIRRSVHPRWAGAQLSTLDLTPAGRSLPAALLFASGPALDALLKHVRSEKAN